MAKSKQSKRKNALAFRVKELIYWREASEGLREVSLRKDQCREIAAVKAKEVEVLLKKLNIEEKAWLNTALTTNTLKQWAQSLFEREKIAA